jgi:hypothetical protein
MVKHKNDEAKTSGDTNTDYMPVATAEEEDDDHVFATPLKAFQLYGSPPPFDLDEYKDSFELWHK